MSKTKCDCKQIPGSGGLTFHTCERLDKAISAMKASKTPPKTKLCPRCNGTGWTRSVWTQPCPTCNGTGIRSTGGQGAETADVPLKDAYDKWASQGRTEEQKWAVLNFLTGVGGVAIGALAKHEEKTG